MEHTENLNFGSIMSDKFLPIFWSGTGWLPAGRAGAFARSQRRTHRNVAKNDFELGAVLEFSAVPKSWRSRKIQNDLSAIESVEPKKSMPKIGLPPAFLPPRAPAR
jgi:hypothetical protein